jgi:hypothetical protein
MFFLKKKVTVQSEEKQPLTFDELYHALWPVIETIGKTPLSNTDPSLNDVSFDREKIQIAFKGIRGMDLKNIGPIDFICWLSTMILVREINLKNLFSASSKLQELLKLSNHAQDFSNLLRLFHKDESHLLEALEVHEKGNRRYLFDKIMRLWYETKLRQTKKK